MLKKINKGLVTLIILLLFTTACDKQDSVEIENNNVVSRIEYVDAGEWHETTKFNKYGDIVQYAEVPHRYVNNKCELCGHIQTN